MYGIGPSVILSIAVFSARRFDGQRLITGDRRRPNPAPPEYLYQPCGRSGDTREARCPPSWFQLFVVSGDTGNFVRYLASASRYRKYYKCKIINYPMSRRWDI
jgi:hypothetical protein